jgi:acetolactate synthase-1/2/3 large subunit
MMNGAESLAKTLVLNEVEVCFTNPGTSEMHFVSALDRVDGIRCVLGLFEGVVTGAADGYYRMAGKPAATLLHLGPGLGNGLANLHNAKKANSGIVNVVGEHALHHIECDAPLTSDIEGVARPMSHWVKVSKSSKAVAQDGAMAIEQARKTPGEIATLILPADTAWGEGSEPVLARTPQNPPQVGDAQIKKIAQVLRSQGPKALILGGSALRGESLVLAGRIAKATGSIVLSEYNNARMERGAGRVRAKSIPFSVNSALELLKDYENIVLVGAKKPVAFFGYPNKPSYLHPSGCSLTELVAIDQDILNALRQLAHELGAVEDAVELCGTLSPQVRPEGEFTHLGIAQVLTALIPEGAIVVDESITTGREFDALTMGAHPHDWLNIMGGSIGFALPTAVGAAIAQPSRCVIALEGDGSAMYTLQSLWTMARENLNVKVIIFANQSYEILKGELVNVGANSGHKAQSMLSLNAPALDWVGLAKAQGVEGFRVTNLQDFYATLKQVLVMSGPQLIEVAMH